MYTRDTAKPVVVDKNFSVTNAGSYTLCIINGDAAGNNRISSAVISINGIEVASPNEFNQQVGTITKPVTLNKDNLISVEVRSIPGSYITVTILGPPKINITFPANGSTLSDSSILVTGTIDDNSASVTVNGVTASVSNNTFSANVTLVEGQNTITVTATNQCGFTTTQSITITKTTIPKGPALTFCVVIAERGPGACNGATAYQDWDVAWLYGEVADPQAELKINGITVDIYDDGSFSFDWEPLVYGPNTITATATNASGTTTTNLTVIYDNIPPKVKITSPLNNAIINTPSITVTGTVADDYPIRRVRVRNININYNYYDANVNNGIFTAENIPLREGINTIIVYVEDMAYNGNSDGVTVYYTSSTAGGSIYGSVSDAINNNPIVGASITITDSTKSQTASTVNNGFFSITNITPGTINGTASKSGYLSNTFTNTINAGEILLMDIRLVPGATISGTITNEATGQSLPGATITITDSQRTLTATANTYGRYTITGIAQGSITINASKTGYLTQENYLTVAAGKTYTANFILKEITSGLTIQITSPYSNTTIYNDKITVSGVINANTADIGVTVNGKPAAIVGNQFVVNEIPITIGQNTITARITDITGNTATTSITIYGEQTQQPIRLTAIPESGITPLTTKLTIENSLINSTGYLSYTGPAMIEINQINNIEIDLKITAEGIYQITYIATDNLGRQYTDTIAIAAISRDAIDNLLKGKWGLMKEALSQGDIENALIHFSENSKSKYRQIFTLLQNNISSIAAGMQQIQLIYLKDGIAKYRIRRQEAQGEITYYIYFEQGKDGIWRIRQY
ncbi:MAG: carboxypeptidase regulatory-like domain-containing protein [Nitrospirae bacterium]|nr:carboxypeptidase regulatory-like domain-containing protein [Nitrospirota bacterium]